ncbi:serine/threonine-protein phosphatase 4 regulatory subunit 3-like [Styela clava]|uniref:serine/threonine-protein phosphatase 4 regulatory subunit 3A-like n=1 Tax=Styela clava TaxID=7725 RepID=UPI001939611F|nr:serine/threonine-protein phosphatase 4 regulatory subunit 3A-like [Styela clava]
MADTRRRVKVYTLNEDRQWDDKGTGHVSHTFDARVHSTTLIVRAEQDGSVLLESKILPDTAYQKQQETLIVWSESDNTDLALSFQEKPGCDEIWEKICQVQGKDPSVSITQDVVDDADDEDRLDGGSDLGISSNEPVELPPCELSQLEEIENLFASCLPTLTRREKLAVAVENCGYIQKLLTLFRMNEDLENVDGLHHLHEIFKTLFMLNKNSIFEVMLDDKNIMDIIGCLEYDPAIGERRKHRDYLTNDAKFKEVIPITNPELKRKIHQTFRVQYIQDVILPTPSVFEENMLSTLNSFVFFNKVEIVNMVQDDDKFLRLLFEQLQDESQSNERRRELAGFLRELCTFSQMLQIMNRDEFFKQLVELGILQTVELLLSSDDAMLRQLGVDIFAHVVEHSPSMVREFAHKEMEENQTNDDELLINLVIEQMICDPDPELSGAMQLMNLLRILLDPENMMANKNEKTEFLSFFYYHCMHVLMAPLLANTAEDKIGKGDYQTANLLSLILELITFSVEHHTYHVKNYILNKDLLRRILILLNSRHRFLALATLRFLRKIISMSDELYNKYIVKGDLLQPVVDVLFLSGKRYNLLNSAILEMFEYIRTEDMKLLITYIAEKHLQSLEKIDYVQTFNGIKQRYEQQKDRANRLGEPMDSLDTSLEIENNRFRRDARTMDEDEEMWFDAEEEEGDILLSLTTSSEDPDMPKVNIDKILEVEKREEADTVKLITKPAEISVNITSSPNNIISDKKNQIAALTNECAKVTNVNGIETNGEPNAEHVTAIPPSETTTSTPIVTVKTGLVGLVDYSDDESEEDEESNGDANKNGKDASLLNSAKATESPPHSTEPARKKPRLQAVVDSN